MKHYLHYSLRALFLLLAVFLSLPMLAVEVEIGGINYELVAKTKQATVISKSRGKKYSGDIVIPESVKYSGITCSVTSIGEGAFSYCEGLTSVTIGSGVTSIEHYAFGSCLDLLDVYCYAENVPSTEGNPFHDSYAVYATLHVPAASVDSYKATEPWSSFGKIVGLSDEESEVEKCATPVVTYADGKLSMACETEGAEFITNVVAEDAKKYYDAEIEFSATYNIEVYATKSGYDNSDTISVALVWIENGEVNDENAIINIEATPVLIQGNGGTLNISGVTNGTEITVYTVSGTEVARTVATESTTTINIGLQSGTIAIVKIGNKSVKIKI